VSDRLLRPATEVPGNFPRFISEQFPAVSNLPANFNASAAVRLTSTLNDGAMMSCFVRTVAITNLFEQGIEQ